MASADDRAVIDRVAAWCDLTLTEWMRSRIDTFDEWLRTEALAAGGLGPREASRVIPRHIADSLTFAQPMASRPFHTLVDLGSGVGLPGIPLAIVFPDVEVVLVDRGGRRTDLADRAIRVVGLDNVEVRQADVRRPIGQSDVVTMRAVLPPAEAIAVVRRWLSPGGTGIVAVSREADSPDPSSFGPETALIAVPADVLDSPGWLLTIRSREHH